MGTAPWTVCRYRGGSFAPVEDLVVEEHPLTLFVNGRPVVTLLTLGEHAEELAVGFLRSEGFLSERSEILSVREEGGAVRVELPDDREAVGRLFEVRTVTTGCGKGTTFYRTLDALQCRPVRSGARFEPAALLRRMAELQERSGLYRKTGGTHNATLADDRATLCFRTDIGRHNAVDMLGGRALLDGWDLGGTMLLSSGRISSEILLKAGRMGVPAVVSRSAPTALALGLAETLGITVVGYARNGRFNVYTHRERIAGAEAGIEASGGADDEEVHSEDAQQAAGHAAQSGGRGGRPHGGGVLPGD